MEDKIGNLTRSGPGTSRNEGKSAPRPGKIGGVARALLAGALPEDAQADIEAQLAQLSADCGPAGPTGSQRVILYSIRGLLTSIWRVNTRIQKGYRGSKKATTELVYLTNCLRRQLKALELPQKPKPRCLADVLQTKVGAK